MPSPLPRVTLLTDFDYHKTQKIGPADPFVLDMVAAVIARKFLSTPGWDLHFNEGCYTFQHRVHKHSVVTFFVDHEGHTKTGRHQAALWQKYGLGITPDPVAVGIELGYEPYINQDLVRDWLGREFRLYQDPRCGRLRYWLRPQTTHLYDFLFLERGRCPYETDEHTLMRIRAARGDRYPEPESDYPWVDRPEGYPFDEIPDKARPRKKRVTVPIEELFGWPPELVEAGQRNPVLKPLKIRTEP